MNIKSKAKAFIKEYSLNSSKVISFVELSEVAVKLNYKIFRPKNEKSKVISALDLQTEFKELSAFSFARDNVKYIFIRSDVPNEVAAALLLHELAHIYLGHLEKSTTPAASDEAEANMFTSYVIEEVYRRRPPHPLSIALAVSGILTLIMSAHISRSVVKLLKSKFDLI